MTQLVLIEPSQGTPLLGYLGNVIISVFGKQAPVTLN